MVFRMYELRRGFTLLEVMIALSILAVGLVVLLETHAMSLRLANHSVLRTKGVLLAEKKMAEIESRKKVAYGEEDGDFGELHPEYSWKEIISPVVLAESSLSGLFRVEVIVSWEEGSSDENVELVTYVAEQ